MDKVAEVDQVDVSISVVSHHQLELIKRLLDDLEKHCGDSRFELILTLNLDESLPFALECFSYPIKLVRNPVPKGFGANHNQAFQQSSGTYFCVMNPDVRLNSDPFSTLLECLRNGGVAMVAPLVLAKDGAVEDSARRFPQPLKLLCKLFGACRHPDYRIGKSLIFPDWVGGMFMLFPRDIYALLGGFDERYFLYYEDVDLCARLRLLGHEIALNPQSQVIHDAQRNSHRSLRYLRWHLRSMARFFLSSVYWRLRRRTRP